MIYGVRQMIQIDEMLDKISSIQGYNIDWEKRTSTELFKAISEEMQKNLIQEVKLHEDSMTRTREMELRLVVHSHSEYNNKIRQMKKILEKNNIPEALIFDLINLFIKDNDIHGPSEPQQDKIYI